MIVKSSRCDEGDKVIDTVKTALRVIELIGDAKKAGVSDLARLAGAPKSTIQRSLITLHEAGWIHPAGLGKRRKWALSSKISLLARLVEPIPRLREGALLQMESLRAATRETIHLTVREGARIVLVERLDSPQALRTFYPVGTSAPLHEMASGKAILAFLPEDELGCYLRSMNGAASDALAGELNDIRGKGYALSDRREEVDVRAIAAPLFDRERKPVAALSISCPATRFGNAKIADYGPLVCSAAAAVSIGKAPCSQA